MKVLVTGANGFIGAQLVRILCDKGVDVRAMVQPGTSIELLDGLDIEIVYGDLLEPSSLTRALTGCRQLYHLAAIYAVWHPTPALMYKVNVEGTVNLMQEAMRQGIERIMHTNSIAAIGVHNDGRAADETTQFNLWGIANDYVLSKYMSELEVLRLVGAGLPAVIVNPCFPFGWGDLGPTPTGNLIVMLLKGQFPVYFDAGFNAVHVTDVAMGHYLGMQHGKIGDRYILGGQNVSYHDFLGQVAEIAGVKRPKYKVNASIVAKLGRINEFIADHVTHQHPLLVDKGVRYTAQYAYFDNSKARRELHYSPRPISEAISESVRWFKTRGLY